jgi:hypothetical protein
MRPPSEHGSKRRCGGDAITADKTDVVDAIE